MKRSVPLVATLLAISACGEAPDDIGRNTASAAECSAASEWSPWTAYAVGRVVSYGGVLYRTLQAHSSQPGWTPDVVGALFSQVACGAPVAGGGGGGGAGSGAPTVGTPGTCDARAWVFMGDSPWACDGHLGESCGWTRTNLNQGYHCQNTSWGIGCEPGGATCASGGGNTGGGNTGGGTMTGGGGGASTTCNPAAWVFMGSDPNACAGHIGESCGWTNTNLGQGYHCKTTSWGAGCESGGATCPGGGNTGGGNTGGGNTGGGNTGGGNAGGGNTGNLPAQTARLRIVNHCAEPIWLAHSTNVPGAQNVRLERDQFHDYAIPSAGLAAARFWPKLGCNANGQSCRVGDNGEGGGVPCGPTGCAPPFDSKFEATFAAIGSPAQTWYNLSLVDGYTLPLSVRPIGAGTNTGTCTPSDCSQLTLDACPSAEALGDGSRIDLRVKDPTNPSRTIACLSPCKAWNYPAPYGIGRPENQDPGLHMCCPTPFDPASGLCTRANGCLSPDACRAPSDPLSVVHTSYVSLIHDRCPSAYGYSYDDEAGLHACPAATMFEVTFCP